MPRPLLLLLVLAAQPALAMEFIAEPPVIHLSGHVEPTDWPVWQEAMERYAGKVDTIVFHDSTGGHSNTGRRIGNSIREKGLRTVVAGRCVSACANMFLGGTVRQFGSRADPKGIVLGYHGSYNRETKAVNMKKSGKYFSELTGGKMDDDLIERFIRIEKKSGALWLSHPNSRTSPADPIALFCTGEEPRPKRAELCERPKGVDALAIGVVTTWDVATVATVAKSKTKGTSKNWE
jgi:hypothetical protein